MKKNVLSLLVGTAALGMAVNVQAADLTITSSTFASEIAVSSAGTQLSDGTNADFKTDGQYGFVQGASQIKYIRYELSNGAKFADIGSATLNVTGTNVTVAQAAGGDGQPYVVYSVTTAAGGSIAVNGAVSFDAFDVAVTSQSAVEITYSLYETAGSAVSGTGALATQKGKLLSFAPALVPGLVTGYPQRIDVAEAKKKFVKEAPTNNATMNDLGALDLTNATNVCGKTGTALTVGDIINTASPGSVVEVTGDFSYLKKTSDTKPGVFLSNLTNCSTRDFEEFKVADDNGQMKATAPLVKVVGGTPSYVCVEADGTTVIPAGTYTAMMKYDVMPGYQVSDSNLGELSRLKTNGSSSYLTMLLSPNGYFANYVRVTNLTNMAGAVHVTLINDAGKSVSFDLKTVTTVDGMDADGKLPAQASTNLILVDDLYAAAQAADATFMVAGESEKLRIVVDGEVTDPFGAGVIIQSVVASTDGTSLNQLQ